MVAETQIDLNGKEMQELTTFIDECMQKEHASSYLIAVMHKAQDLYGYLDRAVMDTVAERMNIPTSHIWGVATFYHYFNLTPQGKYTVAVCMGTACYVKGANKVLDKLKETLDVEVGETTEDGLFTLTEARCLGACGLAPVLMVDDKIYGELDSKNVVKVVNKYKEASRA